MDENKPPIPLSEFRLRSTSGQIPSATGAAPANSGELAAAGQQRRTDRPATAVYYRNESEIHEGFLIALRAIGVADVEQFAEPPKPPAGGTKP